MVRLTVDLIARGTSGFTKKKRDESIQHYLKRLTHLYLEDKCIDEVGEDLSACRNLIVLYLYDNKISKVPNFNSNGNLTHLYLQNNLISRIEHINGLRRLSKLYLGGNSITVLEGLDKLDQLQELHIEHQRLPPGEKLLVDPRTLVGLSQSLQVLNISGNNLDSIRDFQIMSQLTQLMCNENQLNDMKEMAHCLSSWRLLWRLELSANPICQKSKYRDRIIIMAPVLEVLDGKEITATAKQFLKNWQANKDMLKRRRDSMSSKLDSHSFPENGMGELPPVSAPPRHASIPGYMMPALPKKQFQEVLARSNSQPNSAGQGMRTTTTGSFADIVPPKYLNSYGTTYHDPSFARLGSRLPEVKAVNIGCDIETVKGINE